MCGLDAGNGCRGRMDSFEAEHRPCDALDEAMVLLEDVVEVFLLPDGNQLPIALKFEDHIHRLKARKIGAAFVGSVALIFCLPLCA